MSLEQLTLPKTASIKAILSVLNEQGIAVLPDLVEKHMLIQLNSEFERIFKARVSLGFNVTEREEGDTVAIVRNRLSSKDYPAISEIFSSSLMVEIARGYYGSEERLALNHQIYANLNRGTDRPVSGLPFVPHFDKIHTLKFFIYLSDTSKENGAMGVIPGSHIANRKHRIFCLKRDGDFRNVMNIVDASETVPVEGSAGTLLIFSTDTTHGAGHVRSGSERRILRGHTRTTAELEKLGLGKESADIAI